MWECRKNYDPKVMREHLEDMYCCMDVPINATQVGFCANRPRRYGLCLLKSVVMAKFGSLDNVIRLFHRERTAGFFIESHRFQPACDFVTAVKPFLLH